jgi:hypothetical protein
MSSGTCTPKEVATPASCYGVVLASFLLGKRVGVSVENHRKILTGVSTNLERSTCAYLPSLLGS